MKLLLINPPSARYDSRYLAPPLGLLTLAAFCRDSNNDVSILDLNLEMLSNPQSSEEEFYEFVCGLISSNEPDVIGFTSMCLESHVSLELARRLKENKPDTINILGGTHFGAIPTDMLEQYSFIDYVVTGEGENALASILQHVSEESFELPTNVSYRKNGNGIEVGTSAQKRYLLEELPFPAYDLVDLKRYFALNPNHLFNYEAGRGCVFKCSFCYSPFQYGDAVRNKSIDMILSDLRRLVELGAKHLFFVQDNLLNSPKWATKLCEVLVAANLPLTWECYATYPQLQEPLINLLSQAKCIGLFTGIDAVSDASQVSMNKYFLKNWEATSRKLSYCLKKGIRPICAFILEGPDESSAQTESTIRTAMECLNIGCEVHINTLSIYNKTAFDVTNSDRTISYSQIKPELLLDTPSLVQRNSFAQDNPTLFPYHSTHYEVENWERFVTKVYVLWSILIGLPQACYQIGVVHGISIWGVLDYVDEAMVRLTREMSDTDRRRKTILGFASHLDFTDLSPDANTYLGRELARVSLSAREKGRVVHLQVGGLTKGYCLGWFVFPDSMNFDGDLTSPAVIKLEKGLPSYANQKTHELAFQSQDGTIGYYLISPERLSLLLELSTALDRRSAKVLSDGELRQLEDEGWIWPATNPDSGSPALGNRVLAA